MAHAVLETAPTTAPASYDGFDKMHVDGTWRHGRSGRTADDLDPYENDVLVRTPLAKEEAVGDRGIHDGALDLGPARALSFHVLNWELQR